MATSMEEIEKVFKRIDEDGDGKISISELGEILRSLGANTSSEEVARIMAKFDTDGDGSIDLKEFAKIRNGGDGDGVIDLLFHK